MSDDGMQPKPQRSWQQIAEESAVETDPQKLAHLIVELNRALDVRKTDRKDSTSF